VRLPLLIRALFSFRSKNIHESLPPLEGIEGWVRGKITPYNVAKLLSFLEPGV
jgi:hypothetical protein